MPPQGGKPSGTKEFCFYEGSFVGLHWARSLCRRRAVSLVEPRNFVFTKVFLLGEYVETYNWFNSNDFLV